MALFDVRNGTTSLGHSVEKIEHVHAHRRRDMPLEILLCFVLGILLEFHFAVAMYRLLLAVTVVARNEIKTVHTQLQRALVPVKKRRPRVLRIRRVPPRSVLPNNLQIVEIKTSRLRVRGVGLGLFINKNAALRNHARWPAKAKHPTNRVEHVNAHVANDAIAVLGERPPCARMDQWVVRPHRRRPGPHVVIKLLRSLCIGGVASVAHVVITAHLGVGDIPKQPCIHDRLLGLHQVRCAAALCADLHHAIVLAGGGQHRLTFDHIDTRRLLNVDIAPGFDGINHRQRVPMIRRRDQHQIEFILLK